MLGVAAPWAFAQEAATVSFGTAEIMFQPAVAGEGFTLRMSCSDGSYFERYYLDTEAISFAAIGRDGSPLMDARCKYELRSHPFVDWAAVEAAQAAGDGLLVSQLWDAAWRQSRVTRGSFKIVGGLIVALPGETDQETAVVN
jgi:hypothetical protein